MAHFKKTLLNLFVELAIGVGLGVFSLSQFSGKISSIGSLADPRQLSRHLRQVLRGMRDGLHGNAERLEPRLGVPEASKL